MNDGKETGAELTGRTRGAEKLSGTTGTAAGKAGMPQTHGCAESNGLPASAARRAERSSIWRCMLETAAVNTLRAPVGGVDCCAGSGGVVAVAVLKTGGATGEPRPAMAAVVGNMDGAVGVAEWADRGLISNTKLLWKLLG